MSEEHSPWARPGPDQGPAGGSGPPQTGRQQANGSGAGSSAHPGSAWTGFSGPVPGTGARADPGEVGGLPAGRVSGSAPGTGRAGSEPLVSPRPLTAYPGAAPGPGGTYLGGGPRQDAVARGGADPTPDVIEFGRPRRPADQRRLMMKWFGGVAGAIFVVGVVVMLALVMTGHSPLRRAASGPSQLLPPLAKACPPPSVGPEGLPPVPPPPPGARTTDPDSGISYGALGPPWTPWNEIWNAGDLKVRYGVGQHFITETYTDEFGQLEQYHASVLSGSVPAAANDALTLDLKCTGHQVLADVRRSYYPQPNTIEMMRDEVTTLGGRPVWVSKFRLHFHATGLKATSELVGLALVDVGRPNAAILYISIPETVSQYDPVVDQELASMRPT